MTTTTALVHDPIRCAKRISCWHCTWRERRRPLSTDDEETENGTIIITYNSAEARTLIKRKGGKDEEKKKSSSINFPDPTWSDFPPARNCCVATSTSCVIDGSNGRGHRSTSNTRHKETSYWIALFCTTWMDTFSSSYKKGQGIEFDRKFSFLVSCRGRC